jgi:glycerol-3-phosphate dehydrogenase
VAIIGGGVAGLWTRARLEKAGYRCLLLEGSSLGSGQTIASQGIIHGGVKYALGGGTDASKAIAEMPAIWRSCLDGHGEIDLRDARVLSEHQYLWTTNSIASRLGGLAASKVIRTNVRSIEESERTAPWSGAPKGVSVYAVEEPVLDPRSLITALRETAYSPIRQLRAATGYSTLFDLIESNPDGVVLRLHGMPFEPVRVFAKRVVLTAGAGTQQMVEWITSHRSPTKNFGELPPLMYQTRPLHMLMVRGQLPLIHGHCVGLSERPRLTITSQVDTQGRTVWYVGGDIAESGVSRSREEQIAVAKTELDACLPWIPRLEAEYATLRVDRAEGILSGTKGQRPDGPVVAAAGTTIIAFPTKLAFAPLLATRVLEILQHQHVEPYLASPDYSPLAALATPSIAQLPWEQEALQWT